MLSRLDNIAVSIKTPEVRSEPPLALLGGSFTERLRKAASYGYNGVELVSSDPSRLDVAEIKKSIKQHGLKAAAMATGCIASVRSLTLLSSDLEVRAQARSLFMDLIRFAGAIGASVVTLGSFRGRAGRSDRGEALEQLDDALSVADREAADLGVMIALEPINSMEMDLLNTADEAALYIKSRGFRSVGLLLDTYHLDFEAEDMGLILCRHAGAVCHVHIADSGRLPAGKGSIDFKNVEKALDAIGYSRWQSVELSRAGDPDENAELAIKGIREAQSCLR